jgi:hypothetical protein
MSASPSPRGFCSSPRACAREASSSPFEPPAGRQSGRERVKAPRSWPAAKPTALSSG